jgi:NADP-dependent 3-hydroxy acid dehydrogenase YdfG
MLLRNKVAVITGNPYGIGREAAALFANQGARVGRSAFSPTILRVDARFLQPCGDVWAEQQTSLRNPRCPEAKFCR